MHTRERNEITMVWALFNAGTDYYNKTNKYVHTHTREHIATYGIWVLQPSTAGRASICIYGKKLLRAAKKRAQSRLTSKILQVCSKMAAKQPKLFACKSCTCGVRLKMCVLCVRVCLECVCLFDCQLHCGALLHDTNNVYVRTLW